MLVNVSQVAPTTVPFSTFDGGGITNVEINWRPARSMTVARNSERCCFPLPSAIFIPLALH
jgi:hypothetical protein